MDHILRSADINSFPLFSLYGHISLAKLLSNYDGDTADILFIFNDKPMRMKARFFGYDSPEIKISIDDPNRIDKKKKAIEAKEFLKSLCTNDDNNKLIKIKCLDFDKYGRILILAFDENIDISNYNDNELFNLSINFQMIKNGFGYEYYGGSKK